MKHLELLQVKIAQRKKERPSYSNNALARDLKVSGAFLSSVLNGKKDIPPEFAIKLCEKLKFDEYTKSDFLRKLLLSKCKNSIFEKILNEADLSRIESFLPVLDSSSALLAKWYYLAILEHISCSNFTENVECIAKKFSISSKQVEEAFAVLSQEGLIDRNNEGEVFKCNRFQRVSTSVSDASIRNFHSQMINKSIEHLNSKTDSNSYSKRLITGVTVSVNSEKIPLAKELLEKALHHVSSQLTDGDCKEVYQINIQLFPLSEEN